MSTKPALRTIIAGSRSGVSPEDLETAIEGLPWSISVLLCGCAKGADTIGLEWAEREGVPFELYPANWDRYGKRAGYRRNEEMLERADALIALWDGVSKGTSHMIKISEERGNPIRILNVRSKEVTTILSPMFDFYS